MAELIVSDEQAKLLRESGGLVVIRDPQGNVVGSAYRSQKENLRSAFSPEQIARAKARAKSDGPWLTTREVLDHLRKLGS